MKTVNLIALRQFTLEDIAPFLSWLAVTPALQRTTVKMKAKPPVGSGKLTPMLKALEQFKFIQKKQDCFSITSTGESFLRANLFERKSLIHQIFSGEEEVKRIFELLRASPNGRIPKHLINDCFMASTQNSTLETEVLALLDWAHRSELFGHDPKKHEVFALVSRPDLQNAA